MCGGKSSGCRVLATAAPNNGMHQTANSANPQDAVPDALCVRRVMPGLCRFEPVLETLAKIYYHGSWLTSATIARFDGDLRFVTGVEVRFGSLHATFRANKDDDTLVGRSGPWLRLSTKRWSSSASPPW